MKSAVLLLLTFLISTPLLAEPMEGAENAFGRWRSSAAGDFVPINSPQFLPTEKAALSGNDEVIGVSINGDSRAYPLRVMTYHHVANDTVGGEAISVTYCVMANTAVIYDRDPESEGLEVGGLYGGVLALREIGTENCFAQIADVPLPEDNPTSSATRIAKPATLTTWQEWKSLHPDSKVLQPLDNYEIRYLAFDRRSDGFVANLKMNDTIVHQDERLAPGTKIFGISTNGKSQAFLLERIKEQKIIKTTINEQAVTILWNDQLQAPEMEQHFDGYALQSYWYAWAQFYPETEIVK